MNWNEKDDIKPQHDTTISNDEEDILAILQGTFSNTYSHIISGQGGKGVSDMNTNGVFSLLGTR